MFGFGLEDGSVAAEGDVLVLDSRSAAADGVSGAGGGVPQLGKQAPRWPDERGNKRCVVLLLKQRSWVALWCCVLLVPHARAKVIMPVDTLSRFSAAPESYVNPQILASFRVSTISQLCAIHTTREG